MGLELNAHDGWPFRQLPRYIEGIGAEGEGAIDLVQVIVILVLCGVVFVFVFER